MDHGVYSSTMYGISSLGYFWKILLGHASFYLPMYSQIYALFSGVGIVILQSFFIAYSGYLLSIRFGIIIFFAYVLYYPVWFNALFDFHIDHLAIFFLAIFFYMANKKNVFLTSVSAIALIFVKEPFALQTVMCGIYMILVMRTKKEDTANFWEQNCQILLFGASVSIIGGYYFYSVTNFVIYRQPDD